MREDILILLMKLAYPRKLNTVIVPMIVTPRERSGMRRLMK
jgi:hypothetical protein